MFSNTPNKMQEVNISRHKRMVDMNKNISEYEIMLNLIDNHRYHQTRELEVLIQ